MIGTVRGLFTLVLLGLFIALTISTWSRRRNDDFEAAARLPLEDGADSVAEDKRS